MSSFKIVFSADNIRRFRTETVPNFEKFVRLLSTQYPLFFHPELRIQYKDSENDKIDITSELEWVEMYEELKNEKIIKIFIVDGPVRGGGYFKDGPPPQPLYFYEKPMNNQKPGIDEKPHIIEVPLVDPLADLRSRIPKFLQELFPHKHILPHHLPPFLEDIIKVTHHAQNEVELDIDVTQLYDVIHREAMSCLQMKDFTESRDLFRALCILDPEGVKCHYNLACLEALLKNIPESLNSLKKAVEFGWCDLRHTLNDEDLLILRNTEGFQQICTEMANRLNETEKPQTTEKPTNFSAPVVLVPEKALVEETVVPDTHSYEPLPVVPPPVGTDDESKWEVQLGLLHDFGFLNNSLLVPFLEKNDGSVERTVLDLLDI